MVFVATIVDLDKVRNIIVQGDSSIRNTVPSNANCCIVRLFFLSFGNWFRLSTKVTSEVDARHDDCFTTQHNVLLAFNIRSSGYLIAGILTHVSSR